jgi:hypothetical protein
MRLASEGREHMLLRFTEEEEAFRADVNALVNAHFPEVRPYRDTKEDQAEWIAALLERGWAAYKWPIEYGGPDWTSTQRYIWERETASRGVPAQLGGMGMAMLSPVLQGYGDKAQCERHLPGIYRNEIVWCQGYSEPGAGSDLASLRTRAVRDGDHYVVDGAKIWTSGAHKADWMFGLVRTNDEGKPQVGISFLMIDMRSPGIKVRPIIGLDMEHSLNQVTFDGVRVPVENRIGEENKGWTYAKGLLTHERTGLAFVSLSIYLTRRLRVLRRDRLAQFGEAGIEPAFDLRLSELETELKGLETTELRALAELQTGEAPGAYTSILKLKGTDIVQRATTLFLEAAGDWAAPIPPEVEIATNARRIGPEWARPETQRYLIGRSASIAGGSDEIQRNVIAKHVLELP